MIRPIRLLRYAAFAVAAFAAASAAPAQAAAAHTAVVHPAYNSGPWSVENSPGAFMSTPAMGYPTNTALTNGQPIILQCYFWGAPAGPYGNTLWYAAQTDEQYPRNGYINDHYLNTPGTAANPQPQVGHCNGAGYGPLAYSKIFNAVNSPGAWANSPSAADMTGIGVGNGDSIGLLCYYFGAATGPYGNTLWYLAYDRNNNTYGFINDHYLTTPGTAASPQPQTYGCGL